MTSTTAVLPEKTTKTLVWETNYNNKLVCDAFIHLDLAPGKIPVRSSVEEMIFEIRTDDQSHPSIETKLYDIQLFPLLQVTDCLALASHGITAAAFNEFLHTKYSVDIIKHRGVALYFYVKNKI